MHTQYHTDVGLGSCHAIVGPMFSGKTDMLLRELDRYSRLHGMGVEIFLFKPKTNTRDKDGNIRAHSGSVRAWSAEIETGMDALLWIDSKVSNRSRIVVVGIDEAQFVRGLRSFVELALNHRTYVSDYMANVTMHVYLAALDGTYKREAWPEIVAVQPLCHTYRKLTAICSCCGCKEAPFSRRDVASQALELIGAEESYSAVCEECFVHPELRRCCLPSA